MKAKVPHEAFRAEKPASASANAQSETMPDTGTWDGQVRHNANGLDREKQQLDRTFERLQKERKALLDRSTQNMSPAEKSAYKDKLHEINQRIERFNQKKDRFKEKVKKFNSRLRKQDPAGSAGNP